MDRLRMTDVDLDNIVKWREDHITQHELDMAEEIRTSWQEIKELKENVKQLRTCKAFKGSHGEKLKVENATLKQQVEELENESDEDLMLRVLERDLSPDDLHDLDVRESGETE